MTPESRAAANWPVTLLEDLFARTGVSALALALCVNLVLILLLVGGAYLDGVLEGPLDTEFWRTGLAAPLIVTYVLLTLPVLSGRRRRAVEAFRPLVPLDDEEFALALSSTSYFDRRRQWLATAIGVVAGFALLRPWLGFSPVLAAHSVIATALIYSVTGYFIYSALAGARLFAEAYREPLEISVFDLESLEPIARWSLVTAAFFIVGIALSFLVVPWAEFRLETVIVFLPLTATLVLVFFVGMSGIHHAMVDAKRRELGIVRDRLVAAADTLKAPDHDGAAGDIQAAFDSIAAWTAYEDRIKALPEWPYTVSILGQLTVTSLVPGAVWLARLLLPRVLEYLPMQ